MKPQEVKTQDRMVCLRFDEDDEEGDEGGVILQLRADVKFQKAIDVFFAAINAAVEEGRDIKFRLRLSNRWWKLVPSTGSHSDESAFTWSMEEEEAESLRILESA